VNHAHANAGGGFVCLHRVYWQHRLNEIACNSGLTERLEQRKQKLQERIKTVLEDAGLILNHFESDPRGYAVYIDLPDGSYNSFGGRENGYGIGR